MTGIYKIENTVNGKVYIGQSKDIERRWSQHKNELKRGIHTNPNLQREYSLFGSDKFSFKVLEECEIEKLDECEIKWINCYESTNEKYGYNIMPGGRIGFDLPQEYKDKISKRSRGSNSLITIQQARDIKICLALGMNREEISKIFNVSVKNIINSIAQLHNYAWLNPELNDKIYRQKESYRKERNEKILALYDKGYTIPQIKEKLGTSQSVTEKVIYSYRPLKENKYNDIYKKIFEMHDQGINDYRIAKELGVSPSTVGRYLKQGVKPHSSPNNKLFSTKEELSIINFHKQGKTLKEIAEWYKCSVTTIRSIISRFNSIENYENILRETV